MKNILLFLTVLSISWLQSCTDDDCGECMTPPEMFVFNVVDKASGDNLFVNGTYDINELKVVNLLNNKVVEYKYISENDMGYLQIQSIGWQSEVVNVHFTIGEQTLFTLYVDAERKESDCCSFTRFKAIEVGEAESVRNQETGIYRILMP